MRIWAATLALALAGGMPGAAHGDTVQYRIVGDGGGGVRVGATWQDDGVPVGERVVVLLTAMSATGAAVGPARLTPVQDQDAVYELPTRLAPGTWSVVAESATPYLGRGEATLTVGMAASGYPQIFPDTAQPGASAPGWPRTVLWVLVGTLLAGAVAAAVLGRRPPVTRRSSRRR